MVWEWATEYRSDMMSDLALGYRWDTELVKGLECRLDTASEMDRAYKWDTAWGVVSA